MRARPGQKAKPQACRSRPATFHWSKSSWPTTLGPPAGWEHALAHAGSTSTGNMGKDENLYCMSHLRQSSTYAESERPGQDDA